MIKLFIIMRQKDMNFKINKVSINIFYVILMSLMVSCANTEDNKYNGFWFSEKNKMMLLIDDSLIISNYNIFCVQKLLFDKDGSLLVNQKCESLDYKGFGDGVIIAKNDNSIMLAGLDTTIYENMEFNYPKNKIKEVDLSFMNKEFGFPYSTIKMTSEGQLFINGHKKQLSKGRDNILYKFDVGDFESVFISKDFAPGAPIIYVEIIFENEDSKEYKLFGEWFKAPKELQAVVMYLVCQAVNAEADH